MTTVEQGSLRGRREGRGDTNGYARGTGRSIDDARRRGREAQAATRGATALALAPEVTRRAGAGRTATRDAATTVARATVPRATATRATAAERTEATAARVRVDGAARTRVDGVARARVGAARETVGATGVRLRVAPPAPVSVPRAPFVTVVLLMVVAGVLGILVINTKINENAFYLHDLRAQQNTLDRQEQKLEREIAQRESPGNVAAAAARLGLVRAESPTYLRLPDGRELGVPRPAPAGQAPSGPAAQAPAGQAAAAAPRR